MTRPATDEDRRTWFTRTGHCGGCGQPGSYCLCPPSRPCACQDLHVMGSGLDVDAVDVFTDVPAGDGEQESLFG